MSFKQLPLELSDLLILVHVDILHLVQLVLVDSVGYQSCITMNLTVFDLLSHLGDLSLSESDLLLKLIQMARSLTNNLSVLNVLLLKFLLQVSVNVVSLYGLVIPLSQLIVQVLNLVRLRVLLSL